MSKSTPYAGRSEIGGRNQVVDTYATLRGTNRRLDADLANPEPYFPGIGSGDNLFVTVSGVPVTVTLTAGTLTAVLLDLNTQLAPNARAVDDDGCVAIKTTVRGDSAYLEITGGTAIEALGFDLSFGSIRAYAGNVSGGSGGRLGNSEMLAFINRGEGLTSSSINRALTRISTNADIHDATLTTPKMSFKAVGTLAAGSQTVSGDFGIIPIANFGTTVPSIFTGPGLLSRTSDGDGLAPFFALVDMTTGKMSTSRVVAVGVNSISGPPAYTDAVSVTDAGNVLGRSLRRPSAVVIQKILDGNLIRAAYNSFVGAIRVGDLAYIEPAANTSQIPWGNLRAPWVVTKIGSAPNNEYDQIQVRALSIAECKSLNVVFDHVSRTSLNPVVDSSEDYGTVRFETGFFVNADIVRIVVSPPLPGGVTVSLIAPVRATETEYVIGEDQLNLYPVFKSLADEVARALAAEATLAAADLTAPQKSTLTSGGNADSLHVHANTGAAVNHTHTESQVTNLESDLANRSLVGHTHTESQVTNLESDLAGKAPITHYHQQTDIASLAGQMAVLAGGATSNADGYHTHDLGGGGTVGPQGPAGPTGPQGPQGPQGPAGTNGTNGVSGYTGKALVVAPSIETNNPWTLSGATAGMSVSGSASAGMYVEPARVTFPTATAVVQITPVYSVPGGITVVYGTSITVSVVSGTVFDCSVYFHGDTGSPFNEAISFFIIGFN